MLKAITKSLLIIAMLNLTGCWESDTENAMEDMGEKVEETTEEMGEAAQETMEEAGDAMEQAGEATEEASDY